MRIVAVDMSASKGSVALVDQGSVRASFSWEEKRENRQQLFDALKALAVEWSSVDQFVVGRGPGAFSGMRIAFSVVNALAAPDKTPVVAHNSGAALVHARGLHPFADGLPSSGVFDVLNICARQQPFQFRKDGSLLLQALHIALTRENKEMALFRHGQG